MKKLEITSYLMERLKILFSPSYYLEVLRGEKKFRVFLAILTLALLTTVPASYIVFKYGLPIVANLDQKVLTVIDEVYPKELEVTVKNGVVSTNVSEPYYITVNQKRLESLFLDSPESQAPDSKIRLLVIDTKASSDDFEKYQSLGLLTENNLVYYSDNEVKVYPLKEISDLKLNRDFLITQYQTINKDGVLGKLAKVVIFVIPLFIFLGAILVQAIALLLLSLGTYLMARINKLEVSFKRAFVYTAAVAFIPSLIWAALSFIPVVSSYTLSVPTLPTVIILGLSYIGIRQLKLPTHHEA